jgi:putative spermidine/putrescine transport system ATP-binding protein
MLARVRLSQYEDRLPKQLSGGQQQRVALARALVIEPDVLLLDEPLSNLDATLRNEMKIEIRQLQQSLGLTTIFVTHDQDEAMSTADCMVLMHKGKVEQMGPPAEVFGRPRTAFAAGFLGIPNLLEGRAIPGSSSFQVINGPTLRIADRTALTGSAYLALRPEEIMLTTQAPEAGPNILAGRVELMTYHGASVAYQVRTNDGLLLSARVRSPGLGGTPVMPTGTKVHAHWSPEAGVLVQP